LTSESPDELILDNFVTRRTPMRATQERVKAISRCLLSLASCWLLTIGAVAASDEGESGESWAKELTDFVAENSSAARPINVLVRLRAFEPSLAEIGTCPAEWLDEPAESNASALVRHYYQWILSRGYWVRIYRIPASLNVACGILDEPERKLLSPGELELILTAGRMGLDMEAMRDYPTGSPDEHHPVAPASQNPAIPRTPSIISSEIDAPLPATITGYIKKSYLPRAKALLVPTIDISDSNSISASPPSSTAEVQESSSPDFAQTVSDWTAVAASIPLFGIESPVHGASYDTPSGLPLVAHVEMSSLPESSDGPADIEGAASVKWESNRQGYLGSGTAVQVRLMSGVHWITATIGDPGQPGFGSQSALVGISGPTGSITATPTAPGCFSLDWSMTPGNSPAFVTLESNGRVLREIYFRNRNKSGAAHSCPGEGATRISLWARYRGYYQLVDTTPVVTAGADPG
jgi:hypothetical protein